MKKVTSLFPPTHAVLVQFDLTSDLSQITAHKAPALLEVLGKPVLHHWLDRLATAGIRHLQVVASSHPQQLRNYLKQGERWGFESVEYVTTRRITGWQQIDRFASGFTRDYDSAFVSLNSYPPAPLAQTASDENFWTSQPAQRPHTVLPIHSLEDLWLVNMNALRNLPGQAVGRGSYVDPAARLENTVSLGQRIVLASQVTVQNSIIGNDVDIAPGTEVRDTLILGKTLIGSHLKLRRMIVDGSFVYDVQSRRTLEIDDPNLFTRLDKANQKIPLWHRALAVLLALVTLPVWLLKPQQKRLLRIEKGRDFTGSLITQDLSVSMLDLSNAHSSRLLWLFQVIRGRLPLFGVRECTDNEADSLAHTPGVISLADFAGPRDIANTFQLYQHTAADDMKLLMKWLPEIYNLKRSSK